MILLETRWRGDGRVWSPGSSRSAGSFRLEFRGPCDPILPQAIYHFRREAEFADIFIVPVGQDARGTLYEALFC